MEQAYRGQPSVGKRHGGDCDCTHSLTGARARLNSPGIASSDGARTRSLAPEFPPCQAKFEAPAPSYPLEAPAPLPPRLSVEDTANADAEGEAVAGPRALAEPDGGESRAHTAIEDADDGVRADSAPEHEAMSAPAPPPPLEAPTVACDATEAVEARPADERALAMAVKKEQLLEVLFGITCGIRMVWCLEDDEIDEEVRARVFSPTRARIVCPSFSRARFRGARPARRRRVLRKPGATLGRCGMLINDTGGVYLYIWRWIMNATAPACIERSRAMPTASRAPAAFQLGLDYRLSFCITAACI